jgi:thiamine transport system permease protein
MSRRGRWLLAALPLAFVGVLFIYPLAVVALTGFTGDRGRPGALLETFATPSLRGVFWFTLAQATLSTVATLVVGLPGAWVFARLRFRGRATLWAALVVPFVMPTVVVGAAFVNLLGPSGPVNGLLAAAGLGSVLGDPALEVRGSLWALVLAHVFFNYAVVVRTVGGLWGRLDPSVEESARVLGASRVQVLRRVTLPILGPAIVAAASVVFLFSFTSFGAALVLGGGRLRTIEVEIWTQVRSLDLPTAAVLALAQLVLVAGLLVVSGRLQRRQEASLPLRSSRETQRRPRGAAERVVFVGTLTFIAAVLVAPLAGLVLRSVRGPDGWSLDAYRALGEVRAGSVLFVSPLDAIRASVITAFVATVVALVIGGLASVVIAGRGRQRAGSTRGERSGALDALLMLPLGTSAVTIGLGFLLALDEPPLDLRDSWWLVPLAQALVAVPFVVRTVVPVLRAIDDRLREAASVLGASPAQVVRRIDLPLVWRSLLVAGGFALAISLGEFGATVFLARADAPTLPVLVERLLGQPGAVNLSQAMAASTILMALTLAAVLGVERLRTRDLGGF